MSHWTWEYVPQANVAGGLTPAQIDQVEGLAARIADAVAVRRIGTPFDVAEAVSNVKSYGEGPVMIWFLEDYRDDVVLVVRVRVLVLTGTGDRFMTEIDGQSLDDPTKPAVWDKTTAEGRRIMQRLVDLEMPIVAAVNGPAAVHNEYVLIADIVIAADTTVFSDFPHLTLGIVPGDGIYLAWEEAIGLNRARYLTLTQGSFTADQAERWGAVAEVLPPDQVLPRAQEVAEGLAAKPQLLTRYLAVTVRQRLSRRMAEAYQLGSALEGLTGADLAYQQL
jgi:enoyl-CoA hydratase/carnithine racemase